jgi:hypothetical protein
MSSEQRQIWDSFVDLSLNIATLHTLSKKLHAKRTTTEHE